MVFNTLSEYEKYRSDNNFFPPKESNSYYDLNTGRINVYTTVDKQFKLFTDDGSIHVGDDFTIDGNLYTELTDIFGTELVLTNGLYIIDSEFAVYGKFRMEAGSMLILRNGATGVFYASSEVYIDDNTLILVEDGCTLNVYGQVDIHVDVIDSIINNDNVIVDTAAFIKAFGITGPDVEDRVYSLTDYDAYLRTKTISQYTQGEQNTMYGRIGYVWKGGNPEINSTLLELNVLYGEAILGDFRLPILGEQKTPVSNLQVLVRFTVEKGATLYISDTYRDKKYIRPELYLGCIVGNYLEHSFGGICEVDGSIVVSGPDSKITIDRNGLLIIGKDATVELQRGANIISAYNSSNLSLLINGELIIENIEQIKSFTAENISFGPNGRIVVQNKYDDEHKVLWSTPDGKYDTDLYRLFGDRLDHVEYHIQPNTGIKIDKYYEFYTRDMTDWYNGIRIEKAIHSGLIVWHSGAFIELDNAVIPWVDETSSLYQACRIFKSYGSYDMDKLQEVVNRLRYCGCGDVTFRFIHDDSYHDVTLSLDDTSMFSVVNRPMTNDYILNVQNNSGFLFLRNKVPNTKDSTIIQNTSRVISVDVGDNTFTVNPVE